MTATKYLLSALVATLIISTTAEAQMGRGRARMRVGVGPGMFRPRSKRNGEASKFEPSVNLSFGYSFPNLDKNYLPDFVGVYRGSVTQTGPFTGSLDYQFSRSMGIGVLVTHGTVSAPYYDASSATQLFTGKLDNWSFMLNLMRYMPVSKTVTPYFRTAIGVNKWQQDYTDPSGNKVPVQTPDLQDLAYQVGFGAKFNLSKNADLFIEAGYGKYILNGGLSLKF